MPSKRKKNKRRMRKVQAQRKALEERFASSGKGTPGVHAVPAPVSALVPVAKTSKCPVAVPIPLPVIAPIAVPAEVPPAEPVALEVPVTDAIKDKVVKDAEDLGQPPVEPPAEEPDVTDGGESLVIPVSEVTSSIDEPVAIPAESEVQFEDTTSVATEAQVVAQPVETVNAEREAEAERPAEDPAIEVPETAAAAETVAAVETVTETVAPEVEPVADAAVEVDGHVAGVVEEPTVEAEAITVENEPAEDVHAEPEPEEFPLEATVPTEALVEPEPEQKQQQQPALLEEPTPSVKSTSDPIAEEFVDPTVAEEQIPETATDAPEDLSETLSETIPSPEPLPVPAAKEITQTQDEFMPQVETETIKDLAVAGGLTVEAINGCLGATEVAIEG
ncbi:calphotin isoform X3 [Puntigrus tetrazona]|uniref:calphotin isoform X3 n=1 Tax=Puntigrus tetrazona TaxID=1606681 RepID=UPI001C89DC1B|nr:calphotin isoform X3 [Puntigrus tetrazona]